MTVIPRLAGTLRVSQDGEALEVFGQAAKSGRYHVNEFFLECVRGHTSSNA